MKISKRILSLLLSFALILSTMTVGISFTAFADSTESAVRQAVTDFVAEKGNSVTRATLLAAVQEALGDTTITLAAEDYYFKHAVNGAVDEDPNEETRINIKGSDGAVAAVFTVGGLRIGATATVAHTVENYGTLEIATVSGVADSNNSGMTQITSIDNSDTSKKYKVVIPEGHSGINTSVSGLCKAGNADNIVALVLLDHATNFPAYRAFNKLEIVQMADDIVIDKNRSDSQNFINMSTLKYVHLSESWGTRIEWRMFMNCSSLINANIPSTVKEYIENEAFAGTALREIEYPNVSLDVNPFSNPNLPEGEEGRNVFVMGSEMSFVKAAAYAQSKALSVEYVDGDTEELVTSNILSDVIYSGDLAASWNSTLAVADNKVSGTLTLTDTDGDTIPVNYSQYVTAAPDSEAIETIVKTTFENYVTENGNSVTRSGLLEAVKTALADLTENVLLNADDFHIKHAVNGVVDEDPNEETRINIKGSDGAVVAIFRIGRENIVLTKAIPHTIENLGLLPIAEVSGEEDPDYPGKTLITKIDIADASKQYKVVLPEGTSRINVGNNYVGVDFCNGSIDNIIAIVMLDHGPNLTEGYKYFQNLIVLQMDDDIAINNKASDSSSFMGCKALKYAHLSESWDATIEWRMFLNCSSLENVNIPSCVTRIEALAFNGTALREIEYPANVWMENDQVFATGVIAEGEEGRNVFAKGSEMNFAKAAAYAVVGALNAGSYYGDEAEFVKNRILEDVVYSGDLQASWNDTYAVDTENNTVSGTLTITGPEGDLVTINYLETVAEAPDSEETIKVVKSAFEKYVAEKGNSTTRVSLMSAVNEAIASLNAYVSLAEEDFYIKHAVNGVVDEDPNEETRINIKGSDGAVAAIFRIGDQSIAVSKAIPHTVENLGLLPIAEVSGEEDPDYPGKTLITKIDIADASKQYKVVLPEGTSRIKIDTNDTGSVDYGAGSRDSIIAIVVKDHCARLPEGYRFFSNLVVFQMDDDVAIKNNVSGSSNFWGCSNLKYVHLSENWDATIEWRMFLNCSSLENVNIPSCVTRIEALAFNGTALREIEYPVNVWMENDQVFATGVIAEGEEGRNVFAKGSEMSFIKAAAYAAAGMLSAGAYFGDEAEDVKNRILADVIYSGDLKANWNGTYVKDDATNTVTGTLTLTSPTGDLLPIVYEGTLPETETDADTIKSAVEEAFNNHINEKGNSVTRTSLLNAVKAELEKYSYTAKLKDEYFYIKHAVNGVIDEDPNEETRINIAGSDGVVVAVFEVYGQRIVLTKKLAHTVENLGLLPIAEVSGEEDPEYPGKTLITKINIEDSSKQYKVVLPEGTSRIKIDNNDTESVDYGAGSRDNIIAIVVKDHCAKLPEGYRFFNNLVVFQMDDDIEIKNDVSGSSNFWGCSNLKYVHLSENWDATIEWRMFYNCSSLENVNIPSCVTRIEALAFNGTALREIEYPANVWMENDQVFATGVIAEGEEGRNITAIGSKAGFAKAVAYAIYNVENVEYSIIDSKEDLINNIFGNVAYSDSLNVSWNDTFTVNTVDKIAIGTLTIESADGDKATVEFTDEFTMEDGTAKVEYLEFDTADKALAIKIDTVDFVTEIGVELEIATADGTETIIVSTDYVNIDSYNSKAWIALADKVYYCDIDNNGIVEEAVDLVALRNVLLEGTESDRADVTGDGKVDARDIVRMKKIAAEAELEFDIAFEGYTYAFAFGDKLQQEDIQTVTVKPYCIQAEEKVYGETQVLTQFSSEYTPVIKP